jgi:hypothetical protein
MWRARGAAGRAGNRYLPSKAAGGGAGSAVRPAAAPRGGGAARPVAARTIQPVRRHRISVMKWLTCGVRGGPGWILRRTGSSPRRAVSWRACPIRAPGPRWRPWRPRGSCPAPRTQPCGPPWTGPGPPATAGAGSVKCSARPGRRRSSGSGPGPPSGSDPALTGRPCAQVAVSSGPRALRSRSRRSAPGRRPACAWSPRRAGRPGRPRACCAAPAPRSRTPGARRPGRCG